MADSTAGGFWISDNPVVLNNTFPYGRVGIAAPGIEIYFPVAPRWCLAFFCPSIGRQIRESLVPGHPRPKLADPFYAAILHAIEDGSSVPARKSVVDFVNSLQVQQSTRFVYADRDAFGLAEQLLSGAPELGSVSSLWRVGRLGEVGPSLPSMPPGDYLVVEARQNHHVLAITDLTEAAGCWGIAFTTTDEAKLAYVEADAPFDVVTLYHDGQARRVLRAVVFQHVRREGGPLILVRHSDDGLNRLMETIEA